MTQFTDLGLAAPIARAVSAKGYVTPTPIQMQAIPLVLEGGDILGIAATGTGKTAAFALPILHKLSQTGTRSGPGKCRALILSPTRELAAQIADACTAYGASTGLVTLAIYGGISMDKQLKALRRGADIVVATPGRLLDHLERGSLKLDLVNVLVLDEADHMLDLGFIPAVRRIIRALPRDRQTLFFSATMPPAIRSLADDMLKNPKTVSVSPSATPPAAINQSVIFVDASAKRARLAKLLGGERPYGRALVFTRTKRGADKVVKDLGAAGIEAAAIHGNKSQGQRERVLDAFRAGTTAVLVATDIAARGIDIDGIHLIVNFDLPEVPETYVHRIGRTARAGAGGEAIALCAHDERGLLKQIERVMGKAIPSTNESHAKDPSPEAAEPRRGRGRPNQGGRPSQNHGNRDHKPSRREHFQPGRPDRAPQSARPAQKEHARPAQSEAARPAHQNAKPHRQPERKHAERTAHAPHAASADSAGPAISEVRFMGERAPIVRDEAYLRRSNSERASVKRPAGVV